MLRFSSSVIQKSLDISRFSTHPVTRSAFHQAEIYLCTKIGPRYGMVVVASKVKGRQIPNNFGRWMAKETWDSLRVFSGGQQCGTIWDIDMFEQNIDVPWCPQHLEIPFRPHHGFGWWFHFPCVFAGSAHNMILHRASHSGDPMTREVFTSPFGL